jgi:hypothetical protein
MEKRLTAKEAMEKLRMNKADFWFILSQKRLSAYRLDNDALADVKQLLLWQSVEAFRRSIPILPNEPDTGRLGTASGLMMAELKYGPRPAADLQMIDDVLNSLFIMEADVDAFVNDNISSNDKMSTAEEKIRTVVNAIAEKKEMSPKHEPVIIYVLEFIFTIPPHELNSIIRKLQEDGILIFEAFYGMNYHQWAGTPLHPSPYPTPEDIVKYVIATTLSFDNYREQLNASTSPDQPVPQQNQERAQQPSADDVKREVPQEEAEIPERERVYFRTRIAKCLGLTYRNAGETLRKTIEPQGFPVHVNDKDSRWNSIDEINRWKEEHAAEIALLNERQRKPKKTKKKQ